MYINTLIFIQVRLKHTRAPQTHTQARMRRWRPWWLRRWGLTDARSSQQTHHILGNLRSLQMERLITGPRDQICIQKHPPKAQASPRCRERVCTLRCLPLCSRPRVWRAGHPGPSPSSRTIDWVKRDAATLSFILHPPPPHPLPSPLPPRLHPTPCPNLTHICSTCWKWQLSARYLQLFALIKSRCCRSSSRTKPKWMQWKLRGGFFFPPPGSQRHSGVLITPRCLTGAITAWSSVSRATKAIQPCKQSSELSVFKFFFFPSAVVESSTRLPLLLLPYTKPSHRPR